ncbi:TonB-dependent receptor [Novosphingobium sp. P6W]|uniref:TonB-dependent receptor n=1 Tax=Novosphingobium sp. P6W TaxID=1609758 RepID=UPI0013B406F6|nr:TonB-dependent receptor [Novosphingobium sp. P6W]
MHRKTISTLSVSFIALLSSAAVGQTAVGASAAVTPTGESAIHESGNSVASDEGDIIVTAQKRSERLQDVPKSVDVVQGDTLQKLNMRSFSEIDQLAPGLSLTAKEPTQNAVTLRGVGFDPNSGTSPTVDIYFNETPISSGSAFRALYDIGQIEVLRGPQGTLRGRTSPSGAITIATRRADLDEIDGYFQQTVTTQEGINSQGALSVPIVPGVLAVRAAGLFDRNIGAATTNLRTGDQDRDKTESGRLSVAFMPTSALSFDLTYQYLNNRTVMSPMLFTIADQTTDPLLKPSDRSALVSKPGRYSYEGHILSLGTNLDLGGVAVNYIGGYQHIEQGRINDIAYGGSIPNFSSNQAFTTTNQQISQELRLASQGTRLWNFLVGAYYEHGWGQTNVSQDQFLPFGFVAPQQPPLDISKLNVGVYIPNKTTTYAVFTDHRFDLTSRDQVQVGLRYQETKLKSDYRLSLSGAILGPNPIVSSGISDANKNRIFRQLTGGASYRHEFNHDLTAYATYGRSYRPGSVNAVTTPLDESLLVTQPETSNNYEIGLKGAFADRKIQFTIAFYQQDFKNYLAYTNSYLAVSSAKDGVVDNNAAFTFNADARVRGVEGSLSARLGTHFQMGLSATYNDAKFKNAKAPCNDFNGDGVPDSDGAQFVPVGQNVSFCQLSGRLSDQAPWGVSVNAEYHVEVGGDRELFVRGLANYVPKREDPFINVKYGDLLNNSIFLGVRGPAEAYEFSVFAKNLANVAVLTTRGSTQVDYSAVPTGYSVGTAVRPREFGLSFRLNY